MATNRKDGETIRVYTEDKGRFLQIQGVENIPSAPEAFRYILDEYNNKAKEQPAPTQLPPPEIKEVEVIKEVEKPLGENQHIITLSDDALKYINHDGNATLIVRYKLTELNTLINTALVHFLKQLK